MSAMLKKYAEAIGNAQKDRDQKVLAILCKALGVETSVSALDEHRHRLSKHRFESGDAERFYVDGKPVAFATLPVCSQGVNENGLVTVTASYSLTDETLRK